MIKEAYCSKEIYKLLREKGFEGEIHTSYDKDGYTTPVITHQMAMKWLREIHYYNIEIDTLGMMELNNLSWRSAVYYLVNENECYCEDGFDSYEEACEAALKYVLKKIIE